MFLLFCFYYNRGPGPAALRYPTITCWLFWRTERKPYHKGITSRVGKACIKTHIIPLLIYYPSPTFFGFLLRNTQIGLGFLSHEHLPCQFLKNVLFLCLKSLKRCLVWSLLWASVYDLGIIILWFSGAHVLNCWVFFLLLILSCVNSIITSPAMRSKGRQSGGIFSWTSTLPSVFF